MGRALLGNTKRAVQRIANRRGVKARAAQQLSNLLGRTSEHAAQHAGNFAGSITCPLQGVRHILCCCAKGSVERVSHLVGGVACAYFFDGDTVRPGADCCLLESRKRFAVVNLRTDARFARRDPDPCWNQCGSGSKRA